MPVIWRFGTLEQYVPTTVVTQNIDGLHQAAGSKEVHEIHGSIWEVVDVSTGRVVHRFTRDQLAAIAVQTTTLRAFRRASTAVIRLSEFIVHPSGPLNRRKP